MEARFDYASAKTLDKIETIMEDCFASGEILPGERPKIEKRQDRKGASYYAISLPV
jgi:hypothetical protein